MIKNDRHCHPTAFGGPQSLHEWLIQMPYFCASVPLAMSVVLLILTYGELERRKWLDWTISVQIDQSLGDEYDSAEVRNLRTDFFVVVMVVREASVQCQLLRLFGVVKCLLAWHFTDTISHTSFDLTSQLCQTRRWM